VFRSGRNTFGPPVISLMLSDAFADPMSEREDASR